MISININGNSYDRFTNIEVVNELGKTPSYFNVTFPYPSNNRQLFKTLDKYSIEVDGNIIQSGTILSTKVFHDNDSEYISFAGADNTRLINKQYCNQIAVQEQIELTTLINLLTSGLNLKTINNIKGVKIPKVKTRADETVFTVLHRLALKYGFLIISDGTNLVLDKEGSSGFINSVLKFTGVGNRGNLIEVCLTKDYANTYDSFTASSFNYTEENTSTYNKPKNLFNLNKFYYTKESLEAAELQNNLIWEAQLNSSFEQVYCVKSMHHTINNVAPKPNMLIQVEDDFCRIYGVMLIYKTIYGYSAEKGQYLKLELIPTGSFTGSTELNKYRNNLKIGEGF